MNPMLRAVTFLWAFCAAFGLAAQAVAAPAPRVAIAEGAPFKIGVYPEITGLIQPVLLTHAGDGSGRRFVVEGNGRVLMVRKGKVPATFLDIRGQVTTGERRGLLGLAFHPQFAKTGQFFIYYTDTRGRLVVARGNVSAKNPDQADPMSLAPILVIRNQASNHNGGMIAFGPDGYLYIGTGDGGGVGDPFENSQNTYSLLGKILRIDINGKTGRRPYLIPPSNPFRGRSTFRPEIWAMGLRSPWRFSFDKKTGDLFVADLGEDSWEEVNYEAAGTVGGLNFGWSRLEGRHCYPPGRRCKPDNALTDPVAEYSHDEGCSISGGYVYHGHDIKKLDGIYLFGDQCSGVLWGLFPKDPPGTFSMHRLLETNISIGGFGEDEHGELYLLDPRQGTAFRIVPEGFKPPVRSTSSEPDRLPLMPAQRSAVLPEPAAAPPIAPPPAAAAVPREARPTLFPPAGERKSRAARGGEGTAQSAPAAPVAPQDEQAAPPRRAVRALFPAESPPRQGTAREAPPAAPPAAPKEAPASTPAPVPVAPSAPVSSTATAVPAPAPVQKSATVTPAPAPKPETTQVPEPAHAGASSVAHAPEPAPPPPADGAPE